MEPLIESGRQWRSDGTSQNGFTFNILRELIDAVDSSAIGAELLLPNVMFLIAAGFQTTSSLIAVSLSAFTTSRLLIDPCMRVGAHFPLLLCSEFAITIHSTALLVRTPQG